MKEGRAARRRRYICIDLKSYYASVECVARGLDPMTARLLVADESRTDKTICLAVSPALKAIGVPGRPRLFEAKECIRQYEARTGEKITYTVAPPRMAEYIRISAAIYEIYLRYVSPEDIHIYSIDECFLDVTPYLHLYRREAEKNGVSPARLMALNMFRDVLRNTGITATVGIGTNLYLAKVGMDIVAKKQPPDRDGIRIAELDEDDYRLLLWTHRPLTDFWQVGPGTARRLASAGIWTMGDIAASSLNDEQYLYRILGVNAELLIDHAWGIEPACMADIKDYRSDGHSLSTGQVLPRPYRYKEGELVFSEMADLLCADLLSRDLLTPALYWWVSFDPLSLEEDTLYSGPVALDFYGRLHPGHAQATVRMRVPTNSRSRIMDRLMPSFEKTVDHRLLIRRIGICAMDTEEDMDCLQTDLFTDYDALGRERALQRAMLEVRRRFGLNAVFRGMNLEQGATTLERNMQIGGHRAGSAVLMPAGCGKQDRGTGPSETKKTN